MNKHKHYWKEIVKADKTGGFVGCKCGATAYLTAWGVRKFRRYIREGYKPNQIHLTSRFGA
jgi:hypothetical protein